MSIIFKIILGIGWFGIYLSLVIAQFTSIPTHDVAFVIGLSAYYLILLVAWAFVYRLFLDQI